MAITALLGGTTGGVSLNEEYLTVLRVFIRAVSKFSGESATGHGVLALYTLTCFTGSNTGGGGKDDLVTDELCFLGVLLEVVAQCLTDSLLDGTCHLAVAELRLGLSLELGLSDLDTDDGGESFTEVLTGNLYLCLLNLLGYLGISISIRFQRAGECHAKSCKVGTSLNGVDIIDVGVDVLAVVGVIHYGNLDGNALFLGLQVDDIIEEVGAVTVDVAHELLESFLGMEDLGLAEVALLVGTQVGERDGDACVEVGELTHTACDNVVFVFRSSEDGPVGPELLTGTCLVGIAHNLYVIQGLSLLVLLLVDVSVAEDL